MYLIMTLIGYTMVNITCNIRLLYIYAKSIYQCIEKYIT